MATKNICNLQNNNRQSFNPCHDPQYKNLNLNQNHEYSDVNQPAGGLKSNSINENTKLFDNYGTAASVTKLPSDYQTDNYHSKKNSITLCNDKSSSKLFEPFYGLVDQKDYKKQYQVMDANAKLSSSSSTLSLHIAAYENNSGEIIVTDEDDSNKTMPKNDNVKQKPYEFQRQQEKEEENKSQKAEVMKYKASKKLLNCNRGVQIAQHGSSTTFKPASKNDQKLSKCARDMTLQPLKFLPIYMLLLCMSGNTISMLPIMMVAIMAWNSIQAIFNVENVFKHLEEKHAGSLIVQKLIYFSLGTFCAFTLGIYKCHSMGLMPSHASEWFHFIPPPPACIPNA